MTSNRANSYLGTPPSPAAAVPTKWGTAQETRQAWENRSEPARLHAFKALGGPKLFTLPCKFRPNKLVVSKAADWKEATSSQVNTPPAPSFKGGKPATLKLELLFDTTDETDPDVRKQTDKLLQLVLKPDNQPRSHPPFCQFEWGSFLSFMGYVKDVSLTFLMFQPNGVPIRAEVSLTLNQIKDENLLSQNPTSRSEPRKTHVVVEGERLDWIAYQEYGDAAHWRHIARANGLRDPRDLRAGQILNLPALD